MNPSSRQVAAKAFIKNKTIQSKIQPKSSQRKVNLLVICNANKSYGGNKLTTENAEKTFSQKGKILD